MSKRTSQVGWVVNLAFSFNQTQPNHPGWLKKTPLLSRPIVAPMLRPGLGSSESKKNPFCPDDHLIVEPVLMKFPRKFCPSLTTVARLISPLHSTSKDTVAGTDAIGGMPRLANP